MPFFSSFNGSLSAGRRSKGIKNSPQSETGTPKYPKDPRNIWFHLVANQTGEHRSDWRNTSQRDGTEVDVIEESTFGTNYGKRDIRKGASGVQAIEDLGPYRITDAVGSIEHYTGTSNERTYSTKNLVCTYCGGGSLNVSSTDGYSNFTTNSASTTSYRSGYNEVFINMAGRSSWDSTITGTHKEESKIIWEPGTRTVASSGLTGVVQNQFMIYPGSDEINNGEIITYDRQDWVTPNIGTRPFSLEFWMYMMGTDVMSNQATIFSTGSGSTSMKILMTSYPKSLNMSSPLTATVIDGGDKLRNSTWHHIAITRDKAGWEGKLRLFIDGVMIQYADCTAVQNHFKWSAPGDFEFGDDDASPLNGALFDDMRFIVGECVYGSANSFTPPNKKFEQHAGTVECDTDRLKESTGNANDFEFSKVNESVFFHASRRRTPEASHLSGSSAMKYFMNLANTHSGRLYSGSDSRLDPRVNTLAGWTPTYVANTQPAYLSASTVEWGKEWEGFTPNTAMGETTVEDTAFVGRGSVSGDCASFEFQGERDKAVETVTGLASAFRGKHDFTVELCWKKVGDYPTTQEGKHDWPILWFQLEGGGGEPGTGNGSKYVELRSSTELLTSTSTVHADEPRFLTLANYPPTGAVGEVDTNVVSSVGDHVGVPIVNGMSEGPNSAGELGRYKWHHIAIVYQTSSSTVSLYLDGVRTIKFGPGNGMSLPRPVGMGVWDWSDIKYLRYGWGCKIYELQMSAVAKYTGETYKLPDYAPFNGKKGIPYPVSDEGTVFSHYNAYRAGSPGISQSENRGYNIWNHTKNANLSNIITHDGDPSLYSSNTGFLNRDYTARPRGDIHGDPYGDLDTFASIAQFSGNRHDPTIRYCIEKTANVDNGDSIDAAIQFTKVIPGFNPTTNTGHTQPFPSSTIGRPGANSTFAGNTDDFPYDHYGPLMIDFWFIWKTDDNSSGAQGPFQDAYDFGGSYLEVFCLATAAANASSSEIDKPYLDLSDQMRCEIQLYDTYDGRNVYSPKWKFTGLNQSKNSFNEINSYSSATNAGQTQKIESRTAAQEAAENSGAGILDMHGNPYPAIRSELQPQEAETGTWIYESIARFPYSEAHAGNTWFGKNQYNQSYSPNTYCTVEVNTPYHIKMGLNSAGWEYFYVNGRLLEAHHIPMQAEKLTSSVFRNKMWGKRVNSKGEFHHRGVPITWGVDASTYNNHAFDNARVLHGIDKGTISDIRFSSYDIDATQFYIPEDEELKSFPSTLIDP